MINAWPGIKILETVLLVILATISLAESVSYKTSLLSILQTKAAATIAWRVNSVLNAQSDGTWIVMEFVPQSTISAKQTMSMEDAWLVMMDIF